MFYLEYIQFYAEKYNVDPALICAIIKSESKFQKDAHSKAGAIGLMQLMPGTFNDLQKDRKDKEIMDEKNLEDPETNIDYGTYFLSQLIQKFGSEEVSIIAYNAGANRAEKWMSEENEQQGSITIEKIPYDETRKYAKQVIRDRKIYKNLYFSSKN
ncbi:MAG: lytic transglycosylase domain-containing protein [Oscillospiraceae bacterium]|nr:lytic transglycosylase domain-containing protein [Oscillospiraceae bacterium]